MKSEELNELKSPVVDVARNLDGSVRLTVRVRNQETSRVEGSASTVLSKEGARRAATALWGGDDPQIQWFRDDRAFWQQVAEGRDQVIRSLQRENQGLQDENRDLRGDRDHWKRLAEAREQIINRLHEQKDLGFWCRQTKDLEDRNRILHLTNEALRTENRELRTNLANQGREGAEELWQTLSETKNVKIKAMRESTLKEEGEGEDD